MADELPKQVQSTSGAAIQSPSRERITIYAPDGSPHTVAPVDAREILSGGLGYTSEPPEAPNELEQQQSVDGDPPADATDGGGAIASGARRANRGKNGR